MTNTLSNFQPSRREALERLARFAPMAGHQYATGRNTDFGPDAPSSVSRLSPYLRYRLLTEFEVVNAILTHHSLAAADKYVQEVLWRTYWKGWLEMRPSVWTRFIEERDWQLQSFSNTAAVAAAESGSTGIDGFDDYARELVKTGYLHNHARMWFASIWIFTLHLPWVLGADFFLRHLVDADAASNTLSWRWVAGLQTVGKTYLATAGNITRYTNGRFAPVGLARQAIPLTEPPLEPARSLPTAARPTIGERSLLLITPEDMHPESLFSSHESSELTPNLPIDAVIVAPCANLLWGNGARHFVESGAVDTALRSAAHFDCSARVTATLDAEVLITAANTAGVRQIITAYAPVGPVADALAKLAPLLAQEGIALTQIRRPWDELFWPQAKKGFFNFKERIPSILSEHIIAGPLE